ncbi:MAG: Succinyl-diaminopimelate desuccinylase [Verrucomicrobiae bacterium]|nr:Succinyl-diaminopimelate desuccinylase [Verrucomicrobiae bacterium]
MLEQYLRRHRARFLTELQQLVRFPSVSAQPKHTGDIRACCDWVANHFRQIGLRVIVHKTAGHPIVEASTPRLPGLPAVLVYGHYDVQPPEPFDLWKTPPFGAVVRAGKIHGRGASDNKGQFFAHVKAVEALLATSQPLPVNLTFLIEGEEEIGSEALMKFCKQHARRLRAEYIIISDTGMYAKDLPTFTYATRGLTALEVRLDGPGRDLHSGVFGGSVANPVMQLARLLATCTDAKGRVTIPGFYAAVQPLADWERRAWRKLPVNDKRYAAALGAPTVTGETGYTTLERRWARPTFEINGITGGYQGPGSKTIVPAWASAKITCRLVPNQSPEKVRAQVIRHLRRHCPKTVRLTIEPGHCAPAFLTPPTGRGAKAALVALEKAFGQPPVCVREGGTLPILDVFRRHLRGEILLVGLGLGDDNWHSPNEKMELNNFYRGIAMSAELLQRLG